MTQEHSFEDTAINFDLVGADVSNRLKELRQSHHYSHERLIKMLHDIYGIEVSRNSLMNYEQSDPDQPKFGSCLKMNATTLLCLADLYGVPVDYLLGRSEITTNEEDVRIVMEYTGLSQRSAETICNNPDIPYDKIIRSDEFLPLYKKLRKYLYNMELIKEQTLSVKKDSQSKDWLRHQKLFADGLIYSTLEELIGLLKLIAGYNEVFPDDSDVASEPQSEKMQS